MNNKSKLNAFFIVPMIVGVCLVGFTTNSINTVRGTNANNLYTLTVNEISNLTNYSTGIYPVTTEEGNLIRIDCSGAKIETINGQNYNTLMAGKDFRNLEALGSINSITFRNVLNESTINVEYGWDRGNGCEYIYSETFTVTSGDECVIDITEYKPNYFSVVANNALTFQSCDIVYECSQSEARYAVKCSSQYSERGTVTGSGAYKYNDTVTLTATPNPYEEKATVNAPYKAHKFEGWYEGDTCVSTNNPYTFKMPSQDRRIYARFDYEPLTTNDIIYHGNYPQTRETTTSIVNQCNQKAGYFPTASDKRLWTPYNWYVSSSNTTKFGWYIDVDLNNDGIKDYRGVYFTTYRSRTTSGAETTTCYQYINGFRTETVYWFKFEPIAWRVLQNTNGDHLVMANNVLDAHQFNAAEGNATRTDYNGNQTTCAQPIYQYSDLRTFLNLNFYKAAFTATENSKILTTEVDNSSYSTGYSTNSNNPYATSNTNDKIFALSTRELINTNYGFHKYINDASTTRVLYPTDYALCMGAYSSTSSPFGASVFWMRSPNGKNNYQTYYMNYNGSGYYTNTITIYGIVPAMHLVG